MTDPHAVPEQESLGVRARQDFWAAAGSGQFALALALMGVFSAAAALYVAQVHHSSAAATAGWTILLGVGVPAMAAVITWLVIRRRALFAQRDEARHDLRLLRQEREREPIPPAHLERLQQEAIRLVGPIANGQAIVFNERLLDEAFRAHFSHVVDQLDAWIAAVAAKDNAPAALGERLEREVRERGMDGEPYVARVVQPGLLGAVREAGDNGRLGSSRLVLRVIEYPDEVHVEGGAGPNRTLATLHLDEGWEARVADVRTALEALFVEACGWAEARALNETQDAVEPLRQPLIEALRHVSATDVVSYSDDCPICRSNRGQWRPPTPTV